MLSVIIHERIYKIPKLEMAYKVLRAIIEYQAYRILDIFVQSLPDITCEHNLSEAYELVNIIAELNVEPNLEEYYKKGTKKLQRYMAKHVVRFGSNFNQTLSNSLNRKNVESDCFLNMPPLIMTCYLEKKELEVNSKKIELAVDKEDTLLYGIYVWSRYYQRKNPSKLVSNLLQIFKSINYISLSHDYVLKILPALETIYSNNKEISSFIKERRILCMETKIGGMLWLEKARPQEYLTLKKRKYTKYTFVLMVSYDPSEELNCSDIVCFAGHEWVYTIIISKEDEQPKGELRRRNKIEKSEYQRDEYLNHHHEFTGNAKVSVKYVDHDEKVEDFQVNLSKIHSLPFRSNLKCEMTLTYTVS